LPPKSVFLFLFCKTSYEIFISLFTLVTGQAYNACFTGCREWRGFCVFLQKT